LARLPLAVCADEWFTPGADSRWMVGFVRFFFRQGGGAGVKAMRGWMRLALAGLGGNAAGYAAFRGALWATRLLWRSSAGVGAPNGSLGGRVLLVAVTAILFAAPPVLIGALAAHVAGRARPWAGLAAGLWGMGFAWWWPEVPLLGPQAWVGPAILVLLSGLVGGWLMEQRGAGNAL
jgi:hypothetical protein